VHEKGGRQSARIGPMIGVRCWTPEQRPRTARPIFSLDPTRPEDPAPIAKLLSSRGGGDVPGRRPAGGSQALGFSLAFT